MFPELKKKVCSFLVGEEGKVSKNSLLGLGVFLGTSVLVGSLSVKEAHASLCACLCGACAACAACGAACGLCSGPCGGLCSSYPCAHSSHSSYPTHVNDLISVDYSGSAASATHNHHSSHSSG